jgi:hypothetical protein
VISGFLLAQIRDIIVDGVAGGDFAAANSGIPSAGRP